MPSRHFRPRPSALLRAAAIVALAAGTAAAQTPRGRPLAIEDYYRVKTVGAVALSADTHWVTFTVTTRVEESNGTTVERWIVPADGSAPVRLVTAADSAIVPPGGRGTGGRGGNAAPIASPDGKWLATVRDTPPPKVEKVYASDFERRHEERFKGVQFDWVEFHRDGAPFPLPNAKDPQVNPPQEIFLGAADGSGSGAVADAADRKLTALGVRPIGMQWSPDGTTLLFTADSLYRRENSYGRSEVFTVTVPDGRVRRLTPDRDYGYTNAHFSPDGRWILATKQMTTDAIIRKKLNHGGATDLVLIPVNGGAERNLTVSWDYIPAAAQWSPDGKFVYFTGGIGGTTHLFRVSPEGGAVQQVTTGQRRLADFAFDKAMTKVAFTVGLKESPSEISIANIDGTGERQLTHVHDAFTSEVALSRAERLQFKSPDGTMVEGWLTYPYGYTKDGGPYPMIVSNHGGPHSAIEYGFDLKNQYFAANGYFVLEVNFRSSTGYGEKFLWGTWGAWGTRDGQDVIAGIDYAIARFPIDRRKVATIGHSYGGFMTNWLITQYPSRFAAAVSGAGIVNWTSDFGDADIPRTKETEFYGSPWEEKARNIMIRQSPLTYAGRAKAPTLFINGSIDQRVPFSENMQLFVALKKNGVPAKMIEYENMPHAITGSWNVVHRMLNERRWLDTCLRRVP